MAKASGLAVARRVCKVNGMSPAPTACETCGRSTSGSAHCPRHPGARLVDLTDPEDAAWAESMRGLTRQRRQRALTLAGAVGITALLGVVLLGGVAQTDAALAYGRDASVEAVIVIASLVTAVAVVAGRIGWDAFRAVTGRDTTPSAFALRRARGLRAVLGAVGPVLVWTGVHAGFELAGGALGGLGWALLGLAPLGLAAVVGAARMRMPETADVPTAMPIVADGDEEAVDRARARAARDQIRARHKPPTHIKTHGG